MPEATITIADIRAPEQGKKMFKAFDTQGGQWQIWPDKANLYAVGGVYTIEYQSSNFKGTTYNTISKLVSSQGGSPAPSMAAQRPGPAQITPPGQYKLPSYAGNAPTQTDDKGEDIFVCGGFNNIMSNPSVNPLLLNQDEMNGIVLMLRRAWSASKSRPMPRGDMNDEVPL
tara:strand:+ start:2114 stop:2626 length:513 start_codon:yes stop_codon:yes gene_type:complete